MKTITKLRILYPICTIISIFSLLYTTTFASETLVFKMGKIGQIIVQIFQIIIALLLFEYFKKTDKSNAFMLALFGILGVPFSLMAIILPEAIHLAEVFWGLWLIPMGILVIKSKLFPPIIGYALFVGSIGYFGAAISFFLTGNVLEYIDFFTIGEIIWVVWITFVGPKKIKCTLRKQELCIENRLSISNDTRKGESSSEFPLFYHI